MIERIIKFIESTGLSEQKFAESMGVKQQTLNNYTRGINKFPLSFIERMVEIYPDLSSEWLLRGEGPMLKSDTPYKEETETLKKFLKQTDALLAIRDERIRRLELQNAALISGSDIKEVG